MDEIVKKLMAGGVSGDMIEKLKAGLGDKFQSEIMTSGLKGAAAKVGLDASTLPDIDFKNVMEGVKELMGTDIDGDGKTGIGEAVQNLKEAAANTDMSKVKEFAQTQGGGIIAKIKGFFGA
jgi:hypothetical protein